MSSLSSSPSLAPSIQKAPAPNESRQILGRAAAPLFLTADRFKMDQPQKYVAVCVSGQKYIHCTHTFRHLSVYVGVLNEVPGDARRERGRTKEDVS